MALKEIHEAVLKQRSQEGGPFAVLFYTPLCGTCKVAERMIEVALHMVQPEIYRCNVNLLRELHRDWRIMSVPCLARIHPGEETVLKYAMNHMEDVITFLKPIG